MDGQIMEAVSSVGVPAVISFYLLIRIESSLNRLTEAINRLDARWTIDALRHIADKQQTSNDSICQ